MRKNRFFDPILGHFTVKSGFRHESPKFAIFWKTDLKYEFYAKIKGYRPLLVFRNFDPINIYGPDKFSIFPK